MKEEFIQSILQGKKPGKVPAGIAKEPFGELLWAWVQIAYAQLKKTVPKEMDILSKKALRAVKYALHKRLVFLCPYSLVLEMNILRLTEGLIGASPQERYHYFIRTFLADKKNLIQFFEEYKVLGRSINNLMYLWVEQAAEFFQRLNNDLDEIRLTFNQGKALGKIVDIKTSLSDPHNGGRTVYHIKFSSGLELIYKPKRIGIESAFNKMLKFLNDLGISPAMKTFTVLDKDSYGWVECIKHKPCKSKKEAQGFFERTGIYLCLLYLLQATDAHYENIIASGEYPVIIDLETLFQESLHQSGEIKNEIITDWFSVLSTGLLPCILFVENGKKGVDLGGLTGQEGQAIPNQNPTWVNPNTDEMHLVYTDWVSEGVKHRAKLKGKTLSAVDYVEEIASGFDRTYELINKHHHEFLRKGGIIDELASQPVRFVPRGTRIYVQMLRRLCDPQFQREEPIYEKELDLLSIYISDQNQYMKPMIEAEKCAIRLGDIPFFNSKPNSTDLFFQNKVIVSGAFAYRLIDVVAQRIASMSMEAKLQQISYIKQSLYSIRAASEDSQIYTRFQTEGKAEFSDKQILNHVIEIAEDIFSQSIPLSKQNVAWIAMELQPNFEQYCFQQIGENLYSGKSGIALFFTSLGLISGDRKWIDTALNIVQETREEIKKERVDLWVDKMGLGAMSGASSVAYAYYKMGSLLNDPSLIEDAARILSFITPIKIKQDKLYDIVGGNAGLILVLLSLFENSHDKQLLENAVVAGESLITAADVKEENVLRWVCQDKFLTGFSHGTAGIGYALLKLGVITGQHHFIDAAEKAINYERRTFSEQAGNWPDFRKEKSFGMSWCHGAPGIGMSRLCALSLKNNSQFYKEIEVAINTTQNYLESNVDHLCCGNFGRIELLRMAAQGLGRPELLDLAKKQAYHLIEMKKSSHSYRFFANLPGKIFNPGFMTGAAGIGYSLLCFLDKEHVLPKVWVLE